MFPGGRRIERLPPVQPFEAVGKTKMDEKPVARNRRLLLCLCVAVAATALTGCPRPSGYSPEPDASLVQQIRAGGGSAAAVADAGAVAGGTGWGTLKGQFVFDGSPPSLSNLSTGGKDAGTCDVMPIPDESLAVDSGSKGLAHVVIFPRKVSRVHESYEATAAEEVVFDQKACLFLTHVTPLRISQPLRIKNSDPVGHNTNFSPKLSAAFNQAIGSNDSVLHKFSKGESEPFSVTCNVHPWMKAWMIPRSDPYVAVSDKQGNFQLSNLPAGEDLEFQVWHERAPGGLAAKSEWAKGRFKLKIPADGETNLDVIKVSPAALGL